MNPRTNAPAIPAARALLPCLVCGEGVGSHVLQLASVPVDTNRLWGTPEAARNAPRGTIELRFCPGCGHVYNAAYDDDLVDYQSDYENSQMFSPRFKRYAARLADELAARYDLEDRTVVEVGGGHGEFLEILCARAGCHGICFGPSYRPGPNDRVPPGVRFVTDYYCDRYADVPADLIVCRHVLEHFSQPGELVGTVRKAVAGRELAVYFEVPNGEYMLETDALYELIYTHPSYFTRSSLDRLFRSDGFAPTRFTEGFDGQFLAFEGRTGVPPQPPAPVPDERLVRRFASAPERARSRWDEHFAGRPGRATIVWGAGAKAVTFLNAFVPNPDEVAFVVDVNPRKWGRFIAGTGHAIVSPAEVRTHPPEVVIVMNSVYREEIERMLGPAATGVEFVIA